MALDDGSLERLWPVAAVGMLAGCAVVLGAEWGGRAFRSTAPGAWFFGVPGAPLGSFTPLSPSTPLLGILGVYGGLLLLCAAWLRLLQSCRHRAVPPARVLSIASLWLLPFAVAPPLFSHDLYSYAAQGEMVSHLINPYLFGTGVIGVTPFTTLAGSLWANTPSPYGPTFLFLDALATNASGHHVLGDLVVLRLVAMTGLALAALGISSIARSLGRDPSVALVLSVCSPLALTTLVGGAHNDALMAGLLLCGVAAALRGHPVVAVVLCALAAGVKSPALLGVVFIGWNWPGPTATWRERTRRCLAAGVVCTATLAVVSLISGVGWGWIATTGASARISTGVTPVTAVAHLVVAAGNVAGLSLSIHVIKAIFDVTGLVLAAGIVAEAARSSPRTGWVRMLGASLLTLAVLGPVLWAWYLTWGLLLLAPVAGRRLARVVVGVSIAETIIGAASVAPMVRSIVHLGPVAGVGLVAGLVGLASLVPTRRRCGALAASTRSQPDTVLDTPSTLPARSSAWTAT